MAETTLTFFGLGIRELQLRASRKTLFTFYKKIFLDDLTLFSMDLLTFDESTFNQKARELHNLSEKLNDNWEIHEIREKLYLSKRTLIEIKTELQPPEPVDESVDSEDVSAVPLNASEVLSIEYHVLFHPSYQVPVLYFNAYTGDSISSLLLPCLTIFCF